MEQEEFSPEQSLRLIHSMINKTKNSVADDSYYFLLWGWLVFIACIGQFFLKVVVQTPYHPMVWYLMIPGMILTVMHGLKERRTRPIKTYVGEMLNHLWLSIVLTFVVMGFIFARLGWQNCYPFYMLLYAIGCFVTGRSLQFSPLVWGGLGCWVLALVSTFVGFDASVLLCALAILISYIIPGYLLRQKYRQRAELG